MAMRLDQLIENFKKEKDGKPKNRQSVVIYDPENTESMKLPENPSEVVIFLPDNGRDELSHR